MRLLGAVALAACCAAFAAAAQGDDALKPYLSCEFKDGLRIVSTAHLPVQAQSRPVHTADGVKQVSVLDGYRISFGYPGTEPFADVRAELSAPGHYLEDKKTIVHQMAFIAAAGAGSPVPILHEVYSGFDHFQLDDLTINHSPIAMHTFFDDARQVVVTIYFLNAEPSRRKYASMDEFRTLRDRFIEAYFACVRRNGG